MKKSFEHQLDEIRVDLYERTKNMTNDDAVRATNENAKKIAEQYGIKIVKQLFDYTKWQETLYEDLSVEELSQKAMDYMRTQEEG